MNLRAQEEQEQCAGQNDAERGPSTPAVPCRSTPVRLTIRVVASVHYEKD